MLGNILVYVVYILLGIFLIQKPGITYELIQLALGISIILSSLLAIIKFVSDSTRIRFYKLELFFGILGIVLGFLIIFNPFKIFDFFITGFGLWIVLEGLMKIWYGYFFYKKREEIWPLTIGIGVGSIVLGVVLIINPFSGVMIFSRVLGVFVIGSALLNIMNSMLYYKRINNIIKLFN